MEFFRKVKKSIFNFEDYISFADEKATKTIKYLLILTLIFAFLAVIPYIYALSQPEVYEPLLDKYDVNIQELSANYNTYMVCAIVWVILLIEIYIIYLAKVSVDILIISLLGVIISKIMNVKLKYGAILKMSVYTTTLPIILLLVYTFLNLMLNVQMSYFDFAYNAIAYIYIITVIMMIRAENIKNQMEVQKIVKEQQNVKKELKKEKEEQEKKKEEDEEKEKSDEPVDQEEKPETT